MPKFKPNKKDKHHLSEIQSMRKRQTYEQPLPKKYSYQFLPAISSDKSILLLLFATLMASAYAIDSPYTSRLPGDGPKPTPTLIDPEINAVVQFICQDASIQPLNKPNVRYTASPQHPTLVIESCAKKSQPTCNEDTKILQEFIKKKPSKSLVQVSRDKYAEASLLWDADIQKHTIALMGKNVKSSIINIIDPILKTLSNINWMRVISNSLLKNSGNCGEFSQHAISEMYKQLGNDIDKIKIQIVTCLNGKKENFSHVFLLINSNVQDEIIDNEYDISRYMSDLSGMICDPWNKGYYMDLIDNQNDMYKAGSWNKITVKTISYDLSKISDLPAAIANYLCKEVKKLGYPSISIQCGLFAKQAVEREENEEDYIPHMDL